MPQAEERKVKSREASVSFASSGFFVLRTPLLPFQEFLSWGDGLGASAALQRSSGVDEALAADRAKLRKRLRQIVGRPEVREALFVASPSLDDSLELWLREPESERGQKVERTLVRYFTRMVARATPFGLFAGCSVGTMDAQTRLALDPRSSYQRHTRLDMDYLSLLTESVVQQPPLRASLSFRPNSSLYQAAGRLRYVESRLDGKARSYHLSAVEPTDYLISTLTQAAEGARLAPLARSLCEADAEVTAEEANEYIDALVDNQLLVSDFALTVTGPEPVHGMLAQMRAAPELAQMADRLEQAQSELAELDAGGLGSNPDRYRAIAKRLEELPAKLELPRLFQVDLHKPAPLATVGRDVLDQIVQTVQMLHRISSRRTQSALERFREAFRQRYEHREMPLVEVLDEESGIGFEASNAPNAEGSPLLEGLVFPPAPSDEGGTWSAREALLLGKLTAALERGAREIALEESDLKALENKEPTPLPDAFMVMAKVIGLRADSANPGDFRVMVAGADGPSGAKLLGRFCHGDEELARWVRQHLRSEEALRPDAIFAEIVHLPEGRIGNVLLRPLLRDFEIPYLGRSGAPGDKQIPVTDLMVSVVGSRIVLRSIRLGREIVPRMTNAHNYGLRSLGMYRFLCALQTEGAAGGLGFSWGALESAPFLPRVVWGRSVLSRSHWRLGREDLKPLGEAKGNQRFAAVHRLRERLRLPRLIFVVDGDNTLLIDLENALSVETFAHLVKGRGVVRLDEFYPSASELSVHGPEGDFVHELVLPFVRKNGPPRQPGRGRAPLSVPPRSQLPGSAWLYAKLYTGTSGVDQLLRSVVSPIAKGAVASGACDHWFFIRYGDPDWHLRLRFHGPPERLHSELFPKLQSAAAPLVGTGQIWRLQLDTYERELERYGGPEGINISEKIFWADSEAALGIIELLSGDEGSDARWRLALRGMDMLLEDLGLDLKTKLAVLKEARTIFGKEFRAEGQFEYQLGDKYRKERAAIESLLDPRRDEESPLAPGIALLRARSAQMVPLAGQLRACQADGQLQATIPELAQSYLHMHANRMLRAAARAQELVIYDFLTRTYESRLARSRKSADASKPPAEG